MKTYSKGEIIFKKGDLCHSMFDIISGSVGVYVGYGTEHEKRLAVLEAGNFVGEMGLIDVYPRSADAVALEDGTMLEEISDKEFSSYFEDRPERILNIMRQLSSRLRATTKDYEDACRILEELKETQDKPGKRSKSFMSEVKALMDYYNETMKLVDKYSDGAGFFFPFYPDQF